MGCSVKLIINTETNEQTEVELTAAEVKDREAAAKAAIALEAETNAKLTAKKELLAKLGMTEAEVELFLK